MGIARVRSGQAQPQAFFTGFPGITVEQKIDLVAPLDIDMAVGIVFLRAGDTGRNGAGDLRFVLQRGAKAHRFRVGNGLKADLKTAVARGTRGQLGDHRTRCKGLRCSSGDLEHLAGCQGPTAADAAELRLAIEVTLVTQAGIEKTAFALQVFVMGIGIAQHRIRFSVVVGLAVGGAGATGLINIAVQVGRGNAVMVSADVDVFFYYLMAGLQGPHAILPAAAQPGLRTVRQLDTELVVALVIVELHHIDVQAFIAGEAVPDTDVGQQTGDKGQVAFAVLHDLFALGVIAHQVEEKILAFKVVATAQDVFDNLRYRLVLVDTKLFTPPQQGQVRFEGDFVAGFVNRAGQTFETGDYAVQRAQRLHRGRTQTQEWQVVRCTVQAETGVLAEDFFGTDVTVEAGELHAVIKELAQTFLALESEDIEPCIKVANPECVPAVVEKGTQLIEHVLASVATGSQ
ncbi:hypothetical protein D3C85_825620 [compost metagenome]